MSLIPSDNFDPQDMQDLLDVDTVKAEVVRNDRSVATVSSISEAVPARRGRAAAERVIAAQSSSQAPAQPAPAPPINGSPLPAGNGGLKTRSTARSAPGRALAAANGAQDDTSAAQKALSTLKQALPLVQKLLPLLDGNIVAAVGNLLAPRQSAAAQKLDLAPLESHLTEMQLMHHDLRSTVTQQTTSLKRVEDQLEMVKEATDRNTLEQQELMEDLRAIGSKVNLFAALLFGILIISLFLNLLLFMHIKQVLP